MRKDLGDFQTPPELAEVLVRRLGPAVHRPRLLEPTCGRGTWLRAALDASTRPREAAGVEIQPGYCAEARAAVGDRAVIVESDVFALDLRADLPWRGSGPILVVGNPPWVTNAALGRLGSGNRPPRRNHKGLPGLGALTGSSNYDLAEAVWLKLISELAGEDAVIALLCKTTTALAVLDHLRRAGPPFAAEMIEIDARRWFDASVAACFLRVDLGPSAAGSPSPGRIAVYADLADPAPSRTMGEVRGIFASDRDAAIRLEFAIGGSPLHWRQGIKHDAGPVMELTAEAPGGPFRNGLGEAVDVEAERLFPLAKGADLARDRRSRPRRAVIVPQAALGEETRGLERTAPRLWAYLRAHADRFDRRRSSIYEGRPPFSLFGVGPYTFARYKVAVAGIHRPSRFRALGPVDGRPTLLDDTCYMLPCETAAEAAVLAAIMNDPVVLGLLAALAPANSKRPVTKGRLQSIDPSAVLSRTGRPELAARASRILEDDLDVDPGDHDAAIDPAIDRLGLLLSRGGGPTLGRIAGPRGPEPPDEDA